jgi:serine/threonine-protein kinase
MDSARWKRVSDELDALLELPADSRVRRLDGLRADDPALADELTRLLALEDTRPEFLARPVVELALLALEAGQRIGPYRLERRLGEGGMGQVWLATRADGLYERRVALKLLRPGLGNADLRSRFDRERQILARLAHVHIARLLDAGISDDGQPFLALEYVEGMPLTEYARRAGLDMEARLGLFAQVCAAVSHAHANLVVHRDLKPSNILVTPSGEVRLLDFGIAKLLDVGATPDPELTLTGMRAFTLHYAAPEQVRGEPVSTMTDVYSLGVVLYELLTGRKPYRPERPSDAAWEEAILQAEPLRPSLAVRRPAGASTIAGASGASGGAGGIGAAADPAAPGDDDGRGLAARRLARALAGDLDNIILKALAKAPEQRYASVEALAQDLLRHREGRPVLARPQSLGYRASRYLRRHAWAIGTTTGVIAILLSTLAGVTWQARQQALEARRAEAMRGFVIALFENTGAGNRDGSVDVRALLDAGVRRAETELADQRLGRSELLGLIARLRVGLGDYREALAVLDRQASSLNDPEVPDTLRVESVLQRGRALRALGQPERCVQAMRPLQAVAEGEVGARQPLAAAAFLSELGRCERGLADYAAARVLFERSLALRRGEGAAEAESLTDLAALLGDAGQTDGAITGMRQALDRLRSATGERNGLGVVIWRSLGGLYRERGDVPAAIAALRQAQEIALTIYGAGHPATIEVQRQLGSVFSDEGRLAEAEPLVRMAHERLIERLGPAHPDVGSTWNSLGVIAYERGDLDASASALRRAVELWRSPVGAPRLNGGLFNLARTLLAAGDLDGAEAALREARALRVAQFGERHPSVGDAERLLGEVALARGDRADAEAHLRAATMLLEAGYGPDHPRAGRARLALLRLRLQSAADPAPIAGELDQLLARFPPVDGERRKLAWLARGVRAARRCEDGQPAEGLEAFGTLEREVTLALPEGSSTARELEQLRLACVGGRVAGR